MAFIISYAMMNPHFILFSSNLTDFTSEPDPYTALYSQLHISPLGYLIGIKLGR